MSFDEDEHRLHGPIGTLAVVAAKIARIRRGLIDIDAFGDRLALELEDQYRTAKEQDDIRATRFHWQLELEDRREAAGFAPARDKLTRLALQLRDRVVPSPDLLR